MPKPHTIGYSSNRFDQWRLTESGGSISFDRNGQAVFRFPSWENYQQYLRLNERRKDFGNGAALSKTESA